MYMYVIYVYWWNQSLDTHKDHYTTQALSVDGKKREAAAGGSRILVSVNYSSAHHQLPEVLPVLPGDRHHAWIQSPHPLLKEDKKLEFPGTVYKRKCITSVHKNGYTKTTRTLLLLVGGEGRSCGSEAWSKIYMQVIIHAQEWMILHRRQQEGKGKISGLVLQTIPEMTMKMWSCFFWFTNKACADDLSLASLETENHNENICIR